MRSEEYANMVRNGELFQNITLKYDRYINFGDIIKIAVSEFDVSKADTKNVNCSGLR